MNTPMTPEDRLLRQLLLQTEGAESASAAAPHPDVELLALFAAGSLGAEQRSAMIEHVANCETCRQTISHLLILQQSDPENTDATSPAPAISTFDRWRRQRIAAVALAASLLLAVGLWVSHSAKERQLAEVRTYDASKQLLEDRQFDKARELLASSAATGTDSARLQSLRSQAIREIPNSISLAYAGRLTDFGYDPSTGPITKEFGPNWDQIARKAVEAGPLIKAAEEARSVLAKADDKHLEIILNRGHVLLSLGNTDAAIAEFRRATQLAPRDGLAWLGLGLADFLKGDFREATAAFREALQLDPQNSAAAVNLAMSLQREGKIEAALDVWKRLLDRQFSQADRDLAERRILQLQLQNRPEN